MDADAAPRRRAGRRGSSINIYDAKGKLVKYRFAILDESHRTAKAEHRFTEPGVYTIKPYRTEHRAGAVPGDGEGGGIVIDATRAGVDQPASPVAGQLTSGSSPARGPVAQTRPGSRCSVRPAIPADLDAVALEDADVVPARVCSAAGALPGNATPGDVPLDVLHRAGRRCAARRGTCRRRGRGRSDPSRRPATRSP